MDERAGLYEYIVEEYLKCGSVLRVSQILNTNTIKVRRVLITEGLWESATSRNIGDLYRDGKTVREIAQILCMSEKNVQSYLPYTRGSYGGSKSKEAERSEGYRERIKRASENQISAQGPRKDLCKITPVKEADYNSLIMTSEEELLMQRLPGVLKLRFELVSGYYQFSRRGRYDLDPHEEKEFLGLVKADKGIIREVLVPAEMNLHALHYMIQKLFGWENSHLHKFSLSESDFDMVTNGQKMKDYLDLCGSLFMFPSNEIYDKFWDDDYKDGESIKSWLRRKYVDNFDDYSAEGTYIMNAERIRRFKRTHRNLLRGTNVRIGDVEDRIDMEEPLNTLIEKLTLRHLFITAYYSERDKSGKTWRTLQKEFMKNDINEIKTEKSRDPENFKVLIEGLRTLAELRGALSAVDIAICNGDSEDVRAFYGDDPKRVMKDMESDIRDLEKMFKPVLIDSNPAVLPMAEELYYNYDYGDDWLVRITCTDAYTANKNYDVYKLRTRRSKTYSDKRIPPEELQYVDRNGVVVDEELRKELQSVYIDHVPLCVLSDGLNVMDDVGGVQGFYDFLKIINSDDPEDEEEKVQYRSWARMMGWTGRKTAPKNVL